ncbi:hypothetical protein E2542_SST04921 [Spatholobus suberectus]|nr:hypothetical protein E2542_SST04921 [Spatholobus suberectus]
MFRVLILFCFMLINPPCMDTTSYTYYSLDADSTYCSWLVRAPPSPPSYHNFTPSKYTKDNQVVTVCHTYNHSRSQSFSPSYILTPRRHLLCDDSGAEEDANDEATTIEKDQSE